MKLFVSSLLLALVRSSFAFTDATVCADCEYSSGLGFVPGPDCISFYQCTEEADGSIGVELMCCPEGTLWKQEYLTCVDGSCNASRDDCPVFTTPPQFPCPLTPVAGDNTKYMNGGEEMSCPDATIFNETACGCVNGGEKTCESDPLLYFPFAYHFNDIQCHKVTGTPHGDVKLIKDGGYIRLDGDGDYLVFEFLNNYFANNNPEHFAISIWFKQDLDGFNNVNNFPYEGVFGNGECDQSSSFWFTTGGEIQQGGLRTNNGEALFEFDDIFGDFASRNYTPPEIWCQLAFRYSKTEVTMFLNGNVTAIRSINGDLRNTQAATTIGLAFVECLPYFWTGCLDDIMVFDREVTDQEMYFDVFGRDRTPKGIEAPYRPFFRP